MRVTHSLIGLELESGPPGLRHLPPSSQLLGPNNIPAPDFKLQLWVSDIWVRNIMDLYASIARSLSLCSQGDTPEQVLETVFIANVIDYHC